MTEWRDKGKMEDNARHRRKRKSRRGRRRRGGVLQHVVLLVAIAVFCFSVFQLVKIFAGYQKGQSEYDEIRELVVESPEKDTVDNEVQFRVNFEQLLAINSDTVGWIRFYPEPSQISYPLVQGPDNSLYLNKTFSAADNTVGAIFVNVYNNPDFRDRNTIIYGHRMKDNSMFHDLEKYKEQSFWEANPYFYIYTPDGRELVYHIYSVGVVKDTSETYQTTFATEQEYQEFLDMTKEVAAYNTGVSVAVQDTVVTLSTCTKDSNEDRFVVRGVKESERIIE